MDLAKIYSKILEAQDAINAESHKHKRGRSGASSLMPCIAERVTKILSLEGTPEPEGRKTNKGGFWTGHMHHEKCQRSLNEYFNHYNPGFKYQDELYVVVPLVNNWDREGVEALLQTNEPYLNDRDYMLKYSEKLNNYGILIVVSPIDYAFYEGSIDYIDYEFRDGHRETLPFASEKTIFREIYDIKSASDYGYLKLMKHELSEDYKAQFVIYMKGANLQTLNILVLHKAKMFPLQIPVKLEEDPCIEGRNVIYINPSYWNDIIKKQKIIRGYLRQSHKQKWNSYTDLKQIGINEYNFDCLKEDAFTTYCAYNVSHDEDLRVIQDAPCYVLLEYINKETYKRFEKYIEKTSFPLSRGWSHVNVVSITKDSITVKNKSGKEYCDSLYYAFKNYKMRE